MTVRRHTGGRAGRNEMLRNFVEHVIRPVDSLDGLWDFVAEEDRRDRGKLPRRYDRTIYVPSAWEMLPGLENYRGTGWLRTSIRGGGPDMLGDLAAGSGPLPVLGRPRVPWGVPSRATPCCPAPLPRRRGLRPPSGAPMPRAQRPTSGGGTWPRGGVSSSWCTGRGAP